jgi:hypothetical protein
MSGKNSFIQKDPIAEAVKEVMEASLKGNQKVLDKNKNNKLDADDFKILRGEKKAKEDGMKESSNPFSPDYKSQMPSKPGEKAGFDSKKISTGTVYTKKHKAEPAEKESQKEDFSYFKDKLAEALMEERVIDELINEVLSKDASAGDWIHDFVHSDDPKFKGKSKAKRKEMALAAYYAKQRNEEVEQIDELSKSTLGSYVKHAARDVGASRKLAADFKNRADKARKPSAKAASSSLSKKFLATAQKRHAGIGKAVERLTKEEVEQIEESKRPESDTVPFVTDESKPPQHAKDVAGKSLKRMKNEMLGKTGTSE